MDGDTGVLADMKELGVWEPLSVKEQTFKTAIEVMSWVHMLGTMSTSLCCDVLNVHVCLQTAVLLLRIDDIVSGSKKGEAKGGEAGPMGD